MVQIIYNILHFLKKRNLKCSRMIRSTKENFRGLPIANIYKVLIMHVRLYVYYLILHFKFILHQNFKSDDKISSYPILIFLSYNSIISII